MTAHAIADAPLTIAARWTARVWAAGLFLFWGAFFVHHLAQWFTVPGQWPPPWVVGVVALHGLMLVGYVVGWRWEVLGAVLVLATAVPFFYLAAGPNFPLYAAIAAGPAALWLYSSWRGRRPEKQG
jgi:hypothetical protein